MEFIYCRRLKSQYFGTPKSGAPKMRGLPAVAVIAGVFLRHCPNRRRQTGVRGRGPRR